jgi:hypothetical protein
MNYLDLQAAPALIDPLHVPQADLFLAHQLDRRRAQDMGRLPSFLNVCQQDRCPVSSP